MPSKSRVCLNRLYATKMPLKGLKWPKMPSLTSPDSYPLPCPDPRCNPENHGSERTQKAAKKLRTNHTLKIITKFCSNLVALWWHIFCPFENEIWKCSLNGRRIYGGCTSSPPPLRTFLISWFDFLVLKDTKKIFCKGCQNYLRHLCLKYFKTRSLTGTTK